MNRNLCTVARYSHLLEGYTLYASMVLPSLKLNGADISQIDGGSATGIKLSDYNTDIIKECDMLFVDYNEYITSLPIYQEVIEQASKLGKEVVLSRELSIKLNLQPETFTQTTQAIPESLIDCAVPVISVLTQGSNTNQFAIELALRNHFTSKGYNVGQVGTYDASQFFGFDTLPSFMNENRNADQKMLLFKMTI